MPAQTVREIIDKATQAHAELSKLYRALSGSASEPRASLLLDYLSDHEARLGQSLHSVKAELNPNVLDTWIAYGPDDRRWSALRAAPLHLDLSFDEVLDLALRIDETFMNIFIQARDAGPDVDGVTDVLESMVDKARGERDRLAWDANYMQ